MNQRCHLSSGKLSSAATLLLLIACASNGTGFGTGDSSAGTGGSSAITGTPGDCLCNGGGVTGAGGNNPGSGGNMTTGAGGSIGMGGNDASDSGTPACPKGAGQICHEFYANDNSRHRLNYVNEFIGDPAKGYVVWFAPVSLPAPCSATDNSPRTIELVDNANAKSGKAVLVSLETGYAEFDTTDGTKLAQIAGYTGISGACRLPTGETALGENNTIIIVSPTGARVRSIPIPQGDNLRALNRNPVDGHYFFSKTSIIYEVDDQGTPLFSADMGAGIKGYSVLWREGGGAYATTGEPATVIEMDATGNLVSTVGGKGAMFPFLNFFSGFVRLSNGNYVVANWLRYRSDTVPDVVEFAAPPQNRIVWQWRQPDLDFPRITNIFVLR